MKQQIYYALIMKVSELLISGIVGYFFALLHSEQKRLRDFRDEISAIMARLTKVTGDDVSRFNAVTRDQVLVLCARVTEDIPKANANQFNRACCDYCEIQQPDEESARKFLLYRIVSGRHHQGGAPIPNPFHDDQRSNRERMLDALQELRDYAKSWCLMRKLDGKH